MKKLSFFHTPFLDLLSGIIRVFQSDAGFADTCGLLDIGAAVFRRRAAYLCISAINIRNRGNSRCVGKGIFYSPEYPFKALSASGCYSDYRDLKFFLEPGKVYSDMLFPGFIHEIYA